MPPLQRHAAVELLASQTLHTGRIFAVRREEVRLPSGLVQSVDVVEHGGAVCVAATDDQGRLLCVRQYRHAAGDWLVEIPAGRLEPDEDPLAAAVRELEEETGFRAARWELLTRFFPAPGFCSEWMHLYRASGLTPVPGGGRPADDDEELETIWLAPSLILGAGDGGAALGGVPVRDAKTLLAAALLGCAG